MNYVIEIKHLDISLLDTSGHFELLCHLAEIHLLMEPLAQGSGWNSMHIRFLVVKEQEDSLLKD